MDVYVINLDRHFERWTRIQGLLDDQGLSLHRIAGAEGARLADRTAPAKPRPGAFPADSTVLSRFEIGCMLSHRRAWRAFLRSDASHCVVLEDDIHLADGFAGFVTDPKLTASDFELIKLEAFQPRVAADRRRTVRVGGRAVHRLWSYNPGSAAYMVSRAAARRLLALSRGVPEGADSLIFNCEKYRTFGVRRFRIGQAVPAPVIQHVHLRETRPDAMLDSYIAGRRGARIKDRRFSLARLKRELFRPFRGIWYALASMDAGFG